MDDQLTTKQFGWVLGRSDGAVRTMIRDGEIEAARLPAGFRIAKPEVLRVARATIEARAGRTVTDAELERLIDEVLATNAAAEAEARPSRLIRRRGARCRAGGPR